MIKKYTLAVLFVSSFLIGFSQSYQTAIGVKGGGYGGGHLSGGGINFKHFLSGPNAIEATAGGGSNHFHLQVLYEWQKSTGWADGLDWYLGIGGTIGTWRTGYYHPVHDDFYYNSGFYLGANGVIGLDWNLEPALGVPIGLALDAGPSIGIINSRLWGWGGGFAIRYIIK
ncbi:MAG: hypothetical protein R3277_01970 [Brumimicrobium sp.]|nr:hypothetical protein [Brumimicrobium sp.]